MSHVSVTIAGRAYRMACDEGQEEHLLGLGRSLDARIDELRAAFGEIGDMRLSVMAGIMVADELAEAHRKAKILEEELADLRTTHDGALSRAAQAEARVVEAVTEAAARIERVADVLGKNV
jgi:cell division protein ZapA